MATIRLLLLGATLFAVGRVGQGLAATELNDYPTAARADYVFGCMKANGETRQALDEVFVFDRRRLPRSCLTSVTSRRRPC